jgi:hypothetical protein
MSNVTNLTGPITARLVDEIGLIKAQLAPQLERLKELEAKLKANGPGVYTGTHFDATVSESERDTLDMKAVRAKLSPQFITAHTKTAVVTTLRVVARVLNRAPATEVAG